MIWTANINIQLANNEMLMMPIIVIMWTMSLCWEFKVQCDGTRKRSGLLGRVSIPSVTPAGCGQSRRPRTKRDQTRQQEMFSIQIEKSKFQAQPSVSGVLSNEVPVRVHRWHTLLVLHKQVAPFLVSSPGEDEKSKREAQRIVLFSVHAKPEKFQKKGNTISRFQLMILVYSIFQLCRIA